ncbi:MAG: GNAT family N-acetyltransferase [Bacteroidetes bacterium]|nr:GNAT family N-acetyltransferase [Bacteroidota bacterium]
MFLCPAFRLAVLSHLVLQKIPMKISGATIKRNAAGSFVLKDDNEAQLFSSVEDLDPEEWNSIVGGNNFFMSYGFLSTFERTAPASLSFYYVMIRENKKAIAVFYFQVIHLDVEEIAHILQPLNGEIKAPRITKHWGEWLRRTKEEKGFRILINGNNFISGEYGVAMKSGADAEKVYFALAETVKIITKNDRYPAKISSILVKDYFSRDEKIISDHLVSKRYHRFLVEPEMIVDINREWNSFGDYMNAFSKKYRKRAKDVMKDSSAIEVVELSATEIEKNKTEFHRLYFNLHERAKFRLAALTENYFPQMKKDFPLQFSFYGYRFKGKWIAFRSSFHTPDHIEAHFIGIDYSLNHELHLYQRILYDFVNESITSHSPELFLGRTASEMKTTVGAKAHDLVCYIRHRNGLSNQVIRPFIDYLQPSEWTPRNPFKD